MVCLLRRRNVPFFIHEEHICVHSAELNTRGPSGILKECVGESYAQILNKASNHSVYARIHSHQFARRSLFWILLTENGIHLAEMTFIVILSFNNLSK